jgi:hypothetical protein
MIRLITFRKHIASFFKTTTTADRLLMAGLAFCGIVSVAALFLFQRPGKKVEIYIKNVLVYQYDLKKAEVFTIHPGNGAMQIQIKEGKVCVVQSSCPNKLCMKMGKISKTGQAIACVPNGVLIQISSDKDTSWIDAITQ